MYDLKWGIMKYGKDSVIISDSLNGLGTDIYKEYLSHALCLGGACKFEFNGNHSSYVKGIV